MTTREIDERIAAALELVATRMDREFNGPSGVTKSVRFAAAELRAAEPATVVHVERGKSTDAKARESIKDELRRNKFVENPDGSWRPPAEPASEPATSHRLGCYRQSGKWVCTPQCPVANPAPPAPPPSLVERLRDEVSKWRADWLLPQLASEAADALEAAQADSRRLDALDRWVAQLPQPPREDEAGERGKP